MRAGNQPSKNQRVEGENSREISIVQSIQLCFLFSLGSTTSNEANKERDAARRVDHHRAI